MPHYFERMTLPPVTTLPVADDGEAERFATELACNRRAASWPPPAILRAGGSTPVSAHEVIALPGADLDLVNADSVISMAVGVGPDTALLVPGAGRPDGHGGYQLTAAAIGRLRAAEELARQTQPRMILLSGWAGGTSGRTEAVLLHERWSLPEIPVLLEPAARTSAGNAVCASALLAPLSGVRRLVVVSSWGNALRDRLLLQIATCHTHLRAGQHIVFGRAHAATLRPGIVGLGSIPRHIRAARALLRGPEVRMSR